MPVQGGDAYITDQASGGPTFPTAWGLKAQGSLCLISE